MRRHAAWISISAVCMILSAFGAGVGIMRLAARSSPAPPLKWDLAAGQGVPIAGVTGTHGELFYFIEGPRAIDFRLPGGRRARYVVDGGQIRGAPPSVRGFWLDFTASG